VKYRAPPAVLGDIHAMAHLPQGGRLALHKIDYLEVLASTETEFNNQVCRGVVYLRWLAVPLHRLWKLTSYPVRITIAWQELRHPNPQRTCSCLPESGRPRRWAWSNFYHLSVFSKHSIHKMRIYSSTSYGNKSGDEVQCGKGPPGWISVE
jgi:hypothetical protein